MPFKSIRSTVGMSSTSMLGYFEPVISVKLLAFSDPVQTRHGLAFMKDVKFHPQPEQSMQDLPRSVLICGQQSAFSGFHSLHGQLNQLVSRRFAMCLRNQSEYIGTVFRQRNLRFLNLCPQLTQHLSFGDCIWIVQIDIRSQWWRLWQRAIGTLRQPAVPHDLPTLFCFSSLLGTINRAALNLFIAAICCVQFTRTRQK